MCQAIRHWDYNKVHHHQPRQNEDTLWRQHVPNDVARLWQKAATLLRAARTQDMFLKFFRNIFCVPGHKIYVRDKCFTRGKTKQQVGNRITWAMLPRRVLFLPALGGISLFRGDTGHWNSWTTIFRYSPHAASLGSYLHAVRLQRRLIGEYSLRPFELNMEKINDPQDYKQISKLFQETLGNIHAGYEGRFVDITERRDAADRKLDAGYFKGELREGIVEHVSTRFLCYSDCVKICLLVWSWPFVVQSGFHEQSNRHTFITLPWSPTNIRQLRTATAKAIHVIVWSTRLAGPTVGQHVAAFVWRTARTLHKVNLATLTIENCRSNRLNPWET